MGREDRYGSCESCERIGQLRFSKAHEETFRWICVRCRAKSGQPLAPAEVDLLQAEQFTSDRLLRAAAALPPVPAAEPPSGVARGETILVIEDDVDTRNAACAVLSVGGFSALQVGNGKEGLDLLARLEAKPRLILLDLAMPVMNGWDFYEHLSRDRELRSIPVIVLTAYDLEVASGSLRWLRKPIGMDTLLEAVRASCAN
ncbi:MAG TPA: response regulator [Polyangiaceae bacterium]|nr:response regulator [Polyangiaceae bacterium]